MSSLTLTVMAIDCCYSVILHPFKPRISKRLYLGIIIVIWLSVCLFSLPYALFNKVIQVWGKTDCTITENWPFHHYTETIFLYVTQFLVPFLIVLVYYLRVCLKLWNRDQNGIRSEEQNRSSLKMSIIVSLIFGMSWFPLISYNLVNIRLFFLIDNIICGNR